jgi:hypothetical protein
VEGCSDTGLATLVRGGEKGQIGIRGDGAERRRAARDDELENVGLRELEGDEVLSSKFQEGGGASSGGRVAKVRYGDQHVGVIKGGETIGLENTMKWERDERGGCKGVEGAADKAMRGKDMESVNVKKGGKRA